MTQFSAFKCCFLLHQNEVVFAGMLLSNSPMMSASATLKAIRASSTVANINEWKWKLGMLLRSETDQEVASWDKRERRDYEQISFLAKRMGIYSQVYGKAVVVSKFPLPNYRPDLDDRRPQREVVIALSLQRRVEGPLQEHLDRTQLSSGKISEKSEGSKPIDLAENVNMKENSDCFLDGSVMEKVLRRRSLQMRNMQRAWQHYSDASKWVSSASHSSQFVEASFSVIMRSTKFFSIPSVSFWFHFYTYGLYICSNHLKAIR